MVKVIFKKSKPATSGKTAPASVREQRIPDGQGGWKIIRTLDAHSSTFDDDLLYVFNKNVAKARRDNKRLLGSADGVTRKP
jgi:hypothetical protein